MYDMLLLIEAGGLDQWSDAQLTASVPAIEHARGRLDADQALVLAELVRRGRAPETMFGTLMSPHEAQRRTKTAVALADGSLPGVAARVGGGHDQLRARRRALGEPRSSA